MIAMLLACSGPPVHTDLRAPALVVEPAVWYVGPALVGEPVAQTFTLTNTGEVDLHLSSPVLEDDAFALTPPEATTLVPGASTTAQVTWTPTSQGLDTATLAFPSDDPASPAQVSLQAAAAERTLSVLPAWWSGTGNTLDFGALVIGQYGIRDVLVTNEGVLPATVAGITTVGDAEWYALPPMMPFTLLPDEQAVVGVVYEPIDAEADFGALRVFSDDTRAPERAVLLAGTAGTCEDVGDDDWRYIADWPVFEDAFNYAPTIDVVPTLEAGWCPDADCQYDEWGRVVLRFETGAYASAPFTWDVDLYADDGARLYVDGVQVAVSTPNDTSQRHGTVDVAAGWHHLVVMLYAGEGNWQFVLEPRAGLAFDRLCSSHEP